MPFDLSNYFKEYFPKLDLTNSILVKIAIFLTKTNQFSEFDQNDQRIIKDDNNKKLVNDLMNILLDGSVESNKELYKKTNQILQNISEDNKLKQEIFQLFESKKDEISKEENRWEKLKQIKRNNIEDGRKFKRKSGFFEIFAKESGVNASGINIKLINSPITEKQKVKYKDNWENSKYFNLWLRKDGDFREVYATKLADLFYAEEKKEGLFKIRPDYMIMTHFDNRKDEYIFTKYVKKVGSYEKDLRDKIKNIFENTEKSDKEKKNEYCKILDSIEPKSVLKTLFINLFLSVHDKNIGNLLTKTDSDGKISLIPIDFADLYFYKEFGEYKKNQEYKQELLDALKKQDFKKAKEILIKNETIDQGGYFASKYNKFDQNFQSNINLEYQLSKISDEEFKKILKNMLSNESEINQIFDELKKEYEKTLGEKEKEHDQKYRKIDSKDKQDDLERIQIFKEMNSFLEIKDYLNELREVVKNFGVEEDEVEEKNFSWNKMDLENSQEISLRFKKT